MPSEVKVSSIRGSKFGQKIESENHVMHADEPTDVGGSAKGPTPYEFLLSGLGACTSMTLRMYADRKKWDLQDVRITLRHERIHAEDCDDCETQSGMLDQIESRIELVGELDETQKARLLEIAEKCPVHRTLMSEMKIRTVLA